MFQVTTNVRFAPSARRGRVSPHEELAKQLDTFIHTSEPQPGTTLVLEEEHTPDWEQEAIEKNTDKKTAQKLYAQSLTLTLRRLCSSAWNHTLKVRIDVEGRVVVIVNPPKPRR